MLQPMPNIEMRNKFIITRIWLIDRLSGISLCDSNTTKQERAKL